MKKLSLFIVEDDVIQRFVLEKMAETIGLHVNGSADDGEEAIEDITRLRPHIILMDINLNGSISGIEVARKALKIYKPSIIFITANSNKREETRLRELDSYHFITKPVSYQKLRSAIEAASQNHNSEE